MDLGPPAQVLDLVGNSAVGQDAPGGVVVSAALEGTVKFELLFVSFSLLHVSFRRFHFFQCSVRLVKASFALFVCF